METFTLITSKGKFIIEMPYREVNSSLSNSILNNSRALGEVDIIVQRMKERLLEEEGVSGIFVGSMIASSHSTSLSTLKVIEANKVINTPNNFTERVVRNDIYFF